jgi:peptidoglycan-N-acetylglucosamine deacetylase
MLRRSPASARRRWLLQSIIGLITLPLSAVPIWFYGTHTAVGELLTMRMRYEFMAPSTPRLDARSAAVAAADRARTYAGIPVLFYSIGRPTESFDGRFIVNRTHFAEQMEVLRAAGYAPIRVEQLAQYVRTGSRSGLPRKPVLITFDDATTETMLQADPILKATGMRAVMFVTASRASSGSLFSEQWGSLSGYAGNGRWELENRTSKLTQVVHRDGRLETKLVDAQPGESIPAYGARIASDIESAEAQIDGHGAGHAIAFAYPYSNWGQHAAPGIAAELQRVVGRRFSVAFDQDGQSGWRPALPGDNRLHIHRLEVMDWSGAQLVRRLQAGAALGRTVYAERGLDHTYSALRIVRAAKAYRCAGTPGTVLPDRVTVPHTVALSFVDGPSAYTPQILHLLEHGRVHATFFVSQSQLPGRTRILMRMLADRDEIGLGATVVPGRAAASFDATEAQLTDAVRSIQTAVPLSPCLVRPAQRSQTPALVHVAARLGERVALWSVDPRDFSTTDPALIAQRVLREVRPGSIITLHDGGSDRWATVQAIPAILAGLAKRHIAVTTVTALYHRALGPSAARTHHH